MKTTENTQSAQVQTNVEPMENKANFNYEEVEGTPFTIIQENSTYFATIGNHKITEDFQNREELLNDLNTITWDKIVNVVYVMCEKIEKIKELTKNNK